MSEPIIVLEKLTKHYGKHRGIDGLSFSVDQGEFFGFIGPNGAGKSTTIRTLMGLIHPSGGNASISVWTARPRPVSLPEMWAIFPAKTAIMKT